MEEAEKCGGAVYDIPTETNLKQYYIEEENYKGAFGTGKVIAPIKGTSGNNRFYVMALEDVNEDGESSIFCWYYSASGYLDNIVELSENDFGQGRKNSEEVLAKWKSEEWGTQNQNSSAPDIWGKIENEINAGWFLPSKSEWAAFLSIYNIKNHDYHDYWTSSQSNIHSAYTVYLPSSFNDNIEVAYWDVYARLSTTF